jgi:CRISPR system Cascade subunit CasD
MDILILRLDAPLMSFGGVMVDQHGPTDRFPGLSLITGLFGNALGYRHADADKLGALQARIEFAARWDVKPEPFLDYNTVDLGQPKMAVPGWTTRGKPEHRAGGPAAAFGTHQRFRHYWANGVMSVAVALKGQESPSPAELASALREPVRPLFIGRKTCLPSGPLLLDFLDVPDVLAALRTVPRAERLGIKYNWPMEACWPVRLGFGTSDQEVAIYDRRDWHNQVHTGRRLRMEGIIAEVQS